MKAKAKSLNSVQLFATPWAVAYQAPQSMEFSRQEYWSGLPFPSQGDLPNPGIEPSLPHCRQMLSLVAQTVKNPPAMKETGFNPWVGKIPWKRELLPTLVFWPGEFHGQKILAGYSPWGHNELDMAFTFT